MSSENQERGVNIINGSDPTGDNTRSRSDSLSSTKSSPADLKPKKFQNGWSKEQERLMADWSDIATCYRWIHDKSEKIFHAKTLWINLPVIILSTLGGTANFGIQSLFENDENAKKYASFGIGGISLLAGMLTTVGNYLRYAQLEESHRVASIAWGKFQRLVAVELALNPNDRMDSLDFLKICRAELDRLIEQSPPIPKDAISMFENRFGSIKDLKKPDVCGALEHTNVYESSEARLKQAAAQAALMLRRKKQTLSELVTPEMEKRIQSQVETRLNEALEARKKKLEEELELKRQEEIKLQEDLDKAVEDRKKKIQEEIELEKKRLHQDTHNSSHSSLSRLKRSDSQFESRLNYRRGSISQSKNDSSSRRMSTRSVSASPISYSATQSIDDNKNIVITPNNSQQVSQDNIIIISRD